MKKLLKVQPLTKDTSELLLAGGRYAIVDNDDLPRLLKHSWYVTKHGGHAAAWIDGKIILMHRFIIPHSEPHTDHINRNPLDNRKGNLRPCSASRNSSNNDAKGVYQLPSGSWEAKFMHNRKSYSRTFSNREEALEWRYLKKLELR